MFRRRRPLRPARPIVRKIIRNSNIQGNNPSKLREAQIFFQNGQFEKAGNIFQELAEGALKRGFPQAPNLFIKAGFCYVISDLNEKGIDNIFHGFNLFQLRKQWENLKINSSIISEKLRDFGKPEMGNEVEGWVLQNTPAEIQDSIEWLNAGDRKNRAEKRLPSNCRNCGAPVNTKEIEWFNAYTAICLYCGCMIVNE